MFFMSQTFDPDENAAPDQTAEPEVEAEPVCENCAGKLPPNRQRFCSDACLQEDRGEAG